MPSRTTRRIPHALARPIARASALALLLGVAGRPTAAAAQATLGLGLTQHADGTHRVDARTPPQGAAALAGVRVGDVVTGLELDGTALRVPQEVAAALATARAGQVATIRVRRAGRPLVLRATLQAPPAPAAAPAPPAAAPAAGTASPVRLGKYGCAESIPRFRNGAYEYESQGRGYVTLLPGERYVDPTQVAGRVRFDTATGAARFTGGALDAAAATPMAGDRLWIVIPTRNGERRWSCSRMPD